MSVLTEKGAWALINLPTPEAGGAEQPGLVLPHGLGGEAFEQLGKANSILSPARNSLLAWALPRPSFYPINPLSSTHPPASPLNQGLYVHLNLLGEDSWPELPLSIFVMNRNP